MKFNKNNAVKGLRKLKPIENDSKEKEIVYKDYTEDVQNEQENNHNLHKFKNYLDFINNSDSKYENTTLVTKITNSSKENGIKSNEKLPNIIKDQIGKHTKKSYSKEHEQNPSSLSKSKVNSNRKTSSNLRNEIRSFVDEQSSEDKS